jgi:flavin reductase (DIM6/NTAB) family NADH-FMN oxidoreductase RutF
MTTVDADAFRRTLGLFATGVTVVTTVVEGVPHGMTVNAFASVSLDPLLVLVSIEARAGLHGLLPRSGGYAVTILSAEQEAEARWFATRERPGGVDQFEGIPWRPAPVSGAPILARGLAYLDCRITEILPGGDHSIFLGEVLDLGKLEGEMPLLWYRGTYHHAPL